MNEVSEEDFKKLESPSCDLELEKLHKNDELYEAYMNIIDILKEYCDLKDEDYPLIACWIIGTYIHDQFISYPFLFLNAMKGSGKTRTLKIITKLSKDGEIMLSPTEAVLFRTKSTLGIDEFEGIGKKGNNRSNIDNVRELLNACYKKGSKVKRMKQKRTNEGTEQVVEEFDVFRPIVMANIYGMEEVLGDRCITIILEKSNRPEIVNLVEIYEYSEIFNKTKELLNKCSLCSVVSVLEAYTLWNDYIKYIYTLNNNNLSLLGLNNDKSTSKNYTNNYIKYCTNNYTSSKNYTKIFDKIKDLSINGRELEITLPLILVANEVSSKVLDEVISAVKIYAGIRKEDQYTESQDITIIDFVSQETSNDWISIRDLIRRFKDFTQSEYEINSKTFGWSLKRLKLISEKRRIGGGIQVKLDIEKAQKKLEMFK